MSDFDEDEEDFWDMEEDEIDTDDEEDDGGDYFAGMPFPGGGGAGFGEGNMFGMGANFFGFCSRCKKNFAPDEFKAHVKICRATVAQWACPLCTFMNAAHLAVCAVCGTKKSDPKAVGAGGAPSAAAASKDVIFIDDDDGSSPAAAASSSASASSSYRPAPSNPSASPPAASPTAALGPGAGATRPIDDDDVVMLQVAKTPKKNGKREADMDEEAVAAPLPTARLLRCSICRLHNTFDSIIMLASCGHAVCVRCLSNHVVTRPPLNSETCPRKHCTARLMPAEVHSVVKPSAAEEYWSSTYQAVLRKILVSWLPSAYTQTWPGVQCSCGRSVALPDPSVVEWSILRHCNANSISALTQDECRQKCLCKATVCIGCGQCHGKSDELCAAAKLQIMEWLLGALGVMLQDLTGKEGGFDSKVYPISRRPAQVDPLPSAPAAASGGKKRKSAADSASSSSSAAAPAETASSKSQKTTRGRTRSSSKKASAASAIPAPVVPIVAPPVIAVPAAGLAVGFLAGMPILSMAPVPPLAISGALPAPAIAMPALPMVAPLPHPTPVKAKSHKSHPSPPKIPKGVGYEGAADNKNYKSSMQAKQRQQDNQDNQVETLLNAISRMLQDQSLLFEKSLDLYALLRRSPLVGVLSVYLRNDSIQEQLRRSSVFDAVYSLCHALVISEHFLPIACPEVTEEAKVAESLGSLTKPLTTLHKMASLHIDKATALADSSDADSVKTLKLMETIQDIAELAFTHAERMSHILETRHEAIDKEPPAQPEEDSKESVSAAAVEEFLRASRFQMGDILATKPAHIFASMKHSEDFSGPKTRLTRIRREITSLCSDLPDGIYVVADSTNLDFLRAMIVGPKDTPYENGLFCFDIHLPADYPNKPPQVKFVTTNYGTFRFNPNLYSNGHICLSLLGTWSGPGWDPKVSTLLQVLLSIQSMILCEDPYYNEPGWAQNRQANDWRCDLYSSKVRHGTLAIAILNHLRAPPPNFEEVAKAHFWLRRDEITAQVERWLKLDEKAVELIKTHRDAALSFNDTQVPIPIADIAKSIRRLCRIMKPPALPAPSPSASSSGAAASS